MIEHLLAAEPLGIEHPVVNPLAVPRLGARLRKPARRERADAGGDHDRLGRKPVRFGDQHEGPAVLLEGDDALVEMHGCAELLGLLELPRHEILREHPRKPGDVKDVLLRVQGGQLAAGLGQRVDDLRRHAAHAGVEKGEEARGAGADNRDVLEFVLHALTITRCDSGARLGRTAKTSDVRIQISEFRRQANRQWSF